MSVTVLDWLLGITVPVPVSPVLLLWQTSLLVFASLVTVQGQQANSGCHRGCQRDSGPGQNKNLARHPDKGILLVRGRSLQHQPQCCRSRDSGLPSGSTGTHDGVPVMPVTYSQSSLASLDKTVLAPLALQPE